MKKIFPSIPIHFHSSIKDQKSIVEEVDPNNPAFNIHHIPSSISLDTPSERSVSTDNQDQKLSNLTSLPNGNLPTMMMSSSSPFPSSTPAILAIANERDVNNSSSNDKAANEQHQQQQQPQQSSRKLSKLTILEPIDSICWYMLKTLHCWIFFYHLFLLIEILYIFLH